MESITVTDLIYYKRFQVDTNGEYTIFNIPTQDPEKVELFLEQLRNAGVAFCELPDLNLRDGIVQIAVRKGSNGYTKVKTTTKLSWTDKNVKKGKKYTYKVKTVGEEVSGSYSKAKSLKY